MPQIVLFEIEGVIAVSGALRREALLRSMEDEGVAVTAEEYDELALGLPVSAGTDALLHRHGIDGDDAVAAIIVHRAGRYFRERALNGISLAPGAPSFLDSLAGRVRTALVTRAAREEADLLLSMAMPDFPLDCVVTSDDVVEQKPAPESYERGLGRLARRGITSGRCVALEDSLPGIRSARSAGVSCIAVGPLPAFSAMEADAYLPALAGATLDTLRELLGHGEERVT